MVTSLLRILSNLEKQHCHRAVVLQTLCADTRGKGSHSRLSRRRKHAVARRELRTPDV